MSRWNAHYSPSVLEIKNLLCAMAPPQEPWRWKWCSCCLSNHSSSSLLNRQGACSSVPAASSAPEAAVKALYATGAVAATLLLYSGSKFQVKRSWFPMASEAMSQKLKAELDATLSRGSHGVVGKNLRSLMETRRQDGCPGIVLQKAAFRMETH